MSSFFLSVSASGNLEDRHSWKGSSIHAGTDGETLDFLTLFIFDKKTSLDIFDVLFFSFVRFGSVGSGSERGRTTSIVWRLGMDGQELGRFCHVFLGIHRSFDVFSCGCLSTF